MAVNSPSPATRTPVSKNVHGSSYVENTVSTVRFSLHACFEMCVCRCGVIWFDASHGCRFFVPPTRVLLEMSKSFVYPCRDACPRTLSRRLLAAMPTLCVPLCFVPRRCQCVLPPWCHSTTYTNRCHLFIMDCDENHNMMVHRCGLCIVRLFHVHHHMPDNARFDEEIQLSARWFARVASPDAAAPKRSRASAQT